MSSTTSYVKLAHPMTFLTSCACCNKSVACTVVNKPLVARWLVQIEGGGHGVMFQDPEKFAEVVETFMEVTA